MYHGTSSILNINGILLPPDRTNVLSEVGRKKNLNRVFCTEDYNLAKIYAGRTVNVFGGEPVIYKIIDPIDLVQMDSRKGATIWHCKQSRCELV